ncbi:MAG TPA: hypothetical protein VK190_02425 [Pseudoneobacillus sp.]|nr:hypothetical protein [Pseudoneobacillus sp.]
MIIKNPGYKNWVGTDYGIRMNFVKQVSMYDTASFISMGPSNIGQVILISERELNISTPWGEYFVKWDHVEEIEKE